MPVFCVKRERADDNQMRRRVRRWLMPAMAALIAVTAVQTLARADDLPKPDCDLAWKGNCPPAPKPDGKNLDRVQERIDELQELVEEGKLTEDAFMDALPPILDEMKAVERRADTDRTGFHELEECLFRLYGIASSSWLKGIQSKPAWKTVREQWRELGRALRHQKSSFDGFRLDVALTELVEDKLISETTKNLTSRLVNGQIEDQQATIVDDPPDPGSNTPGAKAWRPVNRQVTKRMNTVMATLGRSELTASDKQAISSELAAVLALDACIQNDTAFQQCREQVMNSGIKGMEMFQKRGDCILKHSNVQTCIEHTGTTLEDRLKLLQTVEFLSNMAKDTGTDR